MTLIEEKSNSITIKPLWMNKMLQEMIWLLPCFELMKSVQINRKRYTAKGEALTQWRSYAVIVQIYNVECNQLSNFIERIECWCMPFPNRIPLDRHHPLRRGDTRPLDSCRRCRLLLNCSETANWGKELKVVHAGRMTGPIIACRVMTPAHAEMADHFCSELASVYP